MAKFREITNQLNGSDIPFVTRKTLPADWPQLKTYHGWRKQGRLVKSGAKPMALCQTARAKCFLYPIDQTEPI